ncbi:MAG: dihydropteroate synthase [Deltaproteobacteria bacterium]|nr:dihydropteroate synthase [Deltaproteobacteria bacterium]MBZ0220009.1 dihydropteroate synthase [Deltaproteobacteria bacterium]
MERIGVDPAGVRIMAPKHFHYNLKIEGLTPAEANILKQDALSIGGEAAVACGTVSSSVERTDAIVSGTMRQFTELIGKLGCQPFGLPEVAGSLRRAIENRDLKTWSVRGRKRSFEVGPRTVIMGILNVTPDSFSDGGRFLDFDAAVRRGLEMLKDGADWIDVGGESTRPGAEPVDPATEAARVVPVIKALSKEGAVVSVDTTKAEVARAALEAGASIVNDISAMSFDEKMAAVVAESGAPVVLMHTRGTPRTMQLDTSYEDLMGEVYGWLHSRVEHAVSKGIDPESIIIDPGIGFGKSAEGNMEILRRLRELKSLGRPVLVGLSRKSFLGKFSAGKGAGERLPATLAALAASVLNGASILRVHDVKEAREASALADELARC